MATYLQRLAARAAGGVATPRSVAPARSVVLLDDPFERVEAAPVAVPPDGIPHRAPPRAQAPVVPAPAVAPAAARVVSSAPATPRATAAAAPAPLAWAARSVGAPPDTRLVERVLTPATAPHDAAAEPASSAPVRPEPVSLAPPESHDDLWAALERLALQTRSADPVPTVRAEPASAPRHAAPPLSIEPPHAVPPRPSVPSEPRLSIGKVLVEVVAPPQPPAPTVHIVRASAPRTEPAASSPFRRSFGLGQS